ncbi:RNA-binding protein [Luteolibacter arcticus]|uniref:RNA-binding protein n=1 Tax=Luteolibacter arcticus TaxID=1581411 RepID=A0ABT3GG02_9BACT|nr:RNA-binding protein [Luteolibacter arcticus]MCW1921969.1 RNA-binding protein [Luteolibacter arcticus]
MSKMYVGNLPFSASEDDLREAFGQFGEVTDVALMMDRETGRPRGFAFITMGSKEAMDAAIKGLDGQDLGGRNLTVNEARPREERSGGGGGYGGGGGERRGGGGGGGYGERRGGGGGGGGKGGYGGGGGGGGGKGGYGGGGGGGGRRW